MQPDIKRSIEFPPIPKSEQRTSHCGGKKSQREVPLQPRASLDKAIGQEYITMQSFRDENWCNSVSTGARRSLAI